ncbi:MAG: AMP-binding protein [Conexibacter sp.]|nr:AMP-binding protein [Conexibacter sp.]
MPQPEVGVAAIDVDLSRTLGSVLEAAAAADGDRAQFRVAGRDLSPTSLEARSRSVAGALQGWGVQRGDRIAVMMANCPEFLEAWFGIVRCGAVEVSVHIAYKGQLLEHVLRQSGSTVLFCDAEVTERLRGLDLPDLRRVVVRGDGPAVPGRITVEYEDAVATAGAAELPALTGEDVSSILYTSGTTGPSKGVVLTHSANLHLAGCAIDFLGWTAEDTLYTPFPLFHVSAKFTSVTAALVSGARLVVADRFSASRFWDTMREEGVTSFNAMGAMLSMIAGQPPKPGDRDHSVTRTYCAATPLALWPVFPERFGVRLYEHYGMTETGIVTANREGRVGSCGRPAPWYDVRLGDAEDRPVPVGETGEILVRPKLPGIVLQEYWQRPDATREAQRNLWFHTGDRARADEDGYLYFVDRAKDCIRRRGENISSWEVESTVATHPAVAEAAAYGVPSELGEDEVMVAVVVADGAELDIPELLSYCDDRLARFAVPRFVRLVDELPKTPSQRTQKFALREAGVTDETFDRLTPR